MAGRLCYLLYYPADLGEEEDAKKHRHLIEADRVDDLLTEFGRFTGEFCGGRKMELKLLLQAVQNIRRIDALFSQDGLDRVIDIFPLRRTDRLLHDFMNTGYRRYETGGYRQGALRTGSRSCRPPFSDEAFLEAAGCEDAFLVAPVSRIAYIPLLEGVNLTFEAADGLSDAITERERRNRGQPISRPAGWCTAPSSPEYSGTKG